jgi:DNA-binding transcriptional MerR regulator
MMDKPTAEDLMTIGEMCAAFDVTPGTLRFYESKDLLASKRLGPRRLYSRRDRARLKLTLQGKRFGFSLDQIRQLLDLYDRGDNQREQRRSSRAAARERLQEMESRRAELDSAIADLRARIDWAEETLRTKQNRTAAE